jgi:hypothetical protein
MPMLSTFLEKASGVLDRRFLLTCWFPTFIAGAVALFLGILPYGWDKTWEWWQKQTEPTQIWLPLGALLLVTVAACLLQAFTRPLVRLYEGYWPHWLRRWAVKLVESRWDKLRQKRAEVARHDPAKYTSVQARLHYEHPSHAGLLLPTRLGNMLRSAEAYPSTAYGLDVVFWWPRLVSVLPEAVQKGTEDALTPLLALLNLTTLTSLVAMGGAIYLWRNQVGGWQGLVTVLVAGLLLARLSYLGAVAQARGYGQHIRAAADLYRFDLLKALHQPLPASPQEERELWERLDDWLYNQDRGAAQELTYQHGKKEE